MKTAVITSWIDILGQIVMLFPLFAPFESESWHPVAQAYVSVGSWQVLSVVLHSTGNPAGRSRRVPYARFLGIIAIVAAIGAICVAPAAGSSSWLDILGRFGGWLLITLRVVLFLTAPLLAAWYFSISVMELRQYQSAISHRREIHWKL